MTTRPAPVFYIFHGEDIYSIRSEVRQMRAKMDDPSELNTAIYDGKNTTVKEVIGAVSSVPFLANRRLVIVEGMLTLLGGKSSKGAKSDLSFLLKAIPELPDFARLVFMESGKLPEANPVLKLAHQEDSRGFVKECSRPPDLARWITRRVEFYEGQIEPSAAKALAEALADQDLYAADSECLKLVTYVGGSRAITEGDVANLTPYVPEANIFDIVDALGQGNGRRALTLIHRLLDDPKQAPLNLLGMINRQFRLLIQVREVLDTGGNVYDVPDIKSNFVARKMTEQARRFTMAQLEAIYRNLVETDFAIKTGRVEDLLALDLLTVGLSS